eukprot:g253.t1
MIPSIFIGVALGLLACLCNATGMNIQKYSKGPSVQSMGWNIFGVLLSVSGGIVDMASFSFAPASTLAPLGAMTLVLNLLVAPLININETINTLDIAATVVIGSGVVACVLSSANSAPLPDFTGHELRTFVTRTDAIFFLQILSACVISCIASMWNVERQKKKKRKLGIQGAVYPILAGMLASLTVISAKLLGEIAKAGGPEKVGRDLLALSLMMVSVSGIGNMVSMNRGLGKGNSTLFAIPVFSATSVLFNTLRITVPLGLGLVLGGVGLLVYKATLQTVLKEKKT